MAAHPWAPGLLRLPLLAFSLLSEGADLEAPSCAVSSTPSALLKAPFRSPGLCGCPPRGGDATPGSVALWFTLTANELPERVVWPEGEDTGRLGAGAEENSEEENSVAVASGFLGALKSCDTRLSTVRGLSGACASAAAGVWRSSAPSSSFVSWTPRSSLGRLYSRTRSRKTRSVLRSSGVAELRRKCSTAPRSGSEIIEEYIFRSLRCGFSLRNARRASTTRPRASQSACLALHAQSKIQG
mmetsp:Transcript_12898/g.29628  ORF Transcript_12898/g.29628 Transcript_12898/m.29628 type:complete len:242 (-) Transcript_12898:5189-5914(-)